jgi:hypothetical protein
MLQSNEVSVEDLPEPTAIAIYELLSHVLNTHPMGLLINVRSVTDDGEPVGNFQVSIQSLESMMKNSGLLDARKKEIG